MKRSTIDVDELLTQSRNGNLTQDQLATLVAADLKSRATTSQSKSRRIDDEAAVPSQAIAQSIPFELLSSSTQSVQSTQSMTTIVGTNLPVNVVVARRRRCARVDASIRDVLFDANAPGDNDTPLSLSNRLGAVVTGGTKVQLLDLVARRRIGKPWQSPHSARIERIVIVDAAARLLVSQDVDGVVVCRAHCRRLSCASRFNCTISRTCLDYYNYYFCFSHLASGCRRWLFVSARRLRRSQRQSL
jgi:hypothetical protein